MPQWTCESIEPLPASNSRKRPPRLKVDLRVPGQWPDLTVEQKVAWNKATRAVGELFDLFDGGIPVPQLPENEILTT